MGENPSYNFTEEHKSQQSGEFGAELNELKSNIEEAKIRVAQEAVDKIASDARNAAEAAALAAIEAENTTEAEVAAAFEEVDLDTSLLSFKD